MDGRDRQREPTLRRTALHLYGHKIRANKMENFFNGPSAMDSRTLMSAFPALTITQISAWSLNFQESFPSLVM